MAWPLDAGLSGGQGCTHRLRKSTYLRMMGPRPENSPAALRGLAIVGSSAAALAPAASALAMPEPEPEPLATAALDILGSAPLAPPGLILDQWRQPLGYSQESSP